jgi:hypothetical protein
MANAVPGYALAVTLHDVLWGNGEFQQPTDARGTEPQRRAAKAPAVFTVEPISIACRGERASGPMRSTIVVRAQLRMAEAARVMRLASNTTKQCGHASRRELHHERPLRRP